MSGLAHLHQLARVEGLLRVPQGKHEEREAPLLRPRTLDLKAHPVLQLAEGQHPCEGAQDALEPAAARDARPHASARVSTWGNCRTPATSLGQRASCKPHSAAGVGGALHRLAQRRGAASKHAHLRPASVFLLLPFFFVGRF